MNASINGSLRVLPWILILAGMMTGRSMAVEAAKLDRRAVLFLDDMLIHDSEHVERVVHQGQKAPAPALEPTKPWEGDRLYTMGTVHLRVTKGSTAGIAG